MNLRCTTSEFNNGRIRLYESSYKGKAMTFASAGEAVLFAMGCGTDQAAELRLEMKANSRTENPTES